MPRTKRQGPLNPQRIAEEALQMIDKQGLDTFSSRKLGARLGVEGMALYKHFKNRDEILDAVAEALILELEVPPEGKWQDRVKDFARRYRSLARVHPRAYPLLATRQLATPRALVLVEEVLKALVDTGFELDAAAVLFRTIGNFCNGTALDELAIMRRIAQEPLERGDKGSYLAQLDRAMHPSHFDAQFEAGLSILVDGFERKLLDGRKAKR